MIAKRQEIPQNTICYNKGFVHERVLYKTAQNKVKIVGRLHGDKVETLSTINLEFPLWIT